MGMTNANKLKVFKTLFTTENRNYPIISKNNRVLLTNNYRATPRNMEWFDMTGRSNPRWKAEVIANSANIMRRLGVVVTGGRRPVGGSRPPATGSFNFHPKLGDHPDFGSSYFGWKLRLT